MTAITGAQTREREGVPEPTAGAAPARLCCSHKDPGNGSHQVLWVQELLQQPKKGFISLTILTRGSVADTKPKLSPGDDPTSPDLKALKRLLVVSAHLHTFGFFCYMKCNFSSSSSLLVFTEEFGAIHGGLPVSQVSLTIPEIPMTTHTAQTRHGAPSHPV